MTKYIDPENYDSSLGEDSPSYLYEYDSLGNLTEEATPESRVTDYTYVSGTNRLSQVIIRDKDINNNPVDRITAYTYWGSTYGYQVETVTDARSNVTTYNYDSATGYLTSVVPPIGNSITYVSNSMGDVTSVTDGNGNATSYQYDGIHRQTQITYPDIGAGQKTKVFAWTCCGLDSVTDENGRVTKYDYDQYTHRLWKVHEDGLPPSEIPRVMLGQRPARP